MAGMTKAEEIQKAQNARNFTNDKKWVENYGRNSSNQSAKNIAAQQKKKDAGISDIKSIRVSSGGKSYTMSKDEYQGVKDLYKTQWADNYGQDDEDQLNKRNGVMPRSFANSYKKGDQSLYDLGLPNSKYFEKYLEAYRTYKAENQKLIDSYKAKNKRLNEFYGAVSTQWFDDQVQNGSYDPARILVGDTNTWDQRRQQQFFDLLDQPEWADVKEMYDLTRRKTKVKDPSAYKSIQEYYEAKFDADAKNRAAYAKTDAADAKALATGTKGTEKQLATALGEDIVENERASQYSVGFNFDDFDRVYGENIYRHLLTQGLVDSATGEVVKGRTAGDQIADIDKANKLKEAINTPERYVQTYTGGDYATMMSDLVNSGVPEKSLKAARDEAISRIESNPALTDEERKAQVKAVKDAESAPRKERNSKIASWLTKSLPASLPGASALLGPITVGNWIYAREKDRVQNVSAAKKFLGDYEINKPEDYIAALRDMKANNRPDGEIREAYRIALRNTTSRDREELAIAYNQIDTDAYDVAQRIKFNYYRNNVGEIFGKSDDPQANTIGKADGSSMDVNKATELLNRSLSARGRATEEGIDSDLGQTLELLHRDGVSAPVLREAANRVVSAWSRSGQIPPDKIEDTLAAIEDSVNAYEASEHKEIFETARDELDALGYSPLDIHQAFSRMGWQDALDEGEWARAYYTEFEIPQEMLNSEDAEAWRSMSEDDRIAAANGIWDSMDDARRAELTKDFIDGLEYNPIINKDYGTQITEQWVGAWGKTAIGLISSGLDIAQLVSTAFGNDPRKLAAAIATGQKLKGWDAFNHVVDTMNDVHAKLSMYGKAVDQDFLSDAISTGSDIFAEILRMQTMNFIGTGVANTIFKIAGVPLVMSEVTGTMVPKLTSVGKGLNMLAQMAASVPFISDATANYWVEAMEHEDATIGDAVAYALICGFLEGAVEKLNADHMFKQALGGDKIADELIKSGRHSLSGKGLLHKMKLINMVGSMLGEGGEEALSYFASLVMGNLTFNKDKQDWRGVLTGYDNAQMWKEAGMGAAVGLLANAATLSTYTADDYISDYLLNHNISSGVMDITYASGVVASMSDAELDALDVSADDLLTLKEFKDEVAKILQQEANLQDARSRADQKLQEEAARFEDVKNSLAALQAQINDKNTSSKKKNELSATLYGEDGHGGLYSKYKEAEKALNKAKLEMQALAKTRDAILAEAEKSSEIIRKHYVALHYLTTNEVTAMSDIGMAENAKAKNEPKLNTAEQVIGQAIKQRRLDLVEMDERIREIGITSATLEKADSILKSAESIMSGLDAKLNSVKDGSAKSEANADKTSIKKKPAKELKDSRKTKNGKKKKSGKQAEVKTKPVATESVQTQDAPTEATDQEDFWTELGYSSEDEYWTAMNEEMNAGLVIGEPRNYTEEDVSVDRVMDDAEVAGVSPAEVLEAEEGQAQAEQESASATDTESHGEQQAEEVPPEFDIDDNLFTSMSDVMFGLETPGSVMGDIQKNIDAGRTIRLDEETMNRVRSVATKLGRHVVFSVLPENKGGAWDGDFIYINLYQRPAEEGKTVENIVMGIFVHEFTHSLKTMKVTAEYARLSKFVADEAVREANERGSQDGKKSDWTVNQALLAKKKMYFEASYGVYDSEGKPIEDVNYYIENNLPVPTILTPEKAKDEIVARFLQNHLFMDKRFINSLVRSESSIAGRALNFVQYCLGRIGAENEDARALVNAQRMYAQAFASSNKSPMFSYRNYRLYDIDFQQFKQTAEGKELISRYEDAVRNMNKRAADDAVADWANIAFKDSVAPRGEDGRLLPLYHGTDSSGIVSFYDDVPVFTALDKRVALTYSRQHDVNALDPENRSRPGIYKLYANVKKSLVLDCQGCEWNAITSADTGYNPEDIRSLKIVYNDGLFITHFPGGESHYLENDNDLRNMLVKKYGWDNARAIMQRVTSQMKAAESSGDYYEEPMDTLDRDRYGGSFGGSGSVYISVPMYINPYTRKRTVLDRKSTDVPINATTDEIVAWARKQKNADGSDKYDSVLFKNVIDADETKEGGGLGTNLVVFDPRNLKSADGFTFENGNVIDIRDRFNTSINNFVYDLDDTDFDDSDYVDYEPAERRAVIDAVVAVNSGNDANGENEKFIRDMAKRAYSVGEKVQRNLNNVMDAIIRNNDFLVGKLASNKSEGSIYSKVTRKAKDPILFDDLARGCFLIKNYDQDELSVASSSVISALKAAGIRITEVDDKFRHPNSWGYRGLHIGINLNGLACELQFATEEVWWKVKEESEKIYSKWRDRLENRSYRLSPQEQIELAKDKAASRKLWDEAAIKYGFPPYVDTRRSSNSSHGRHFAFHGSQSSTGSTHSPSTSSTYGGTGSELSAGVAKKLPSNSITPSDLSTSNTVAPPNVDNTIISHKYWGTVMNDIDDYDFFDGDLDVNESSMREQLRQLDEQINAPGGADDEVVRQRDKLQKNLNAIRTLRETPLSNSLDRFDTPNNTSKHSFVLDPSVAASIGKPGAFTADEVDTLYRALDDGGKRSLIASVAQGALKTSKARDGETGRLIIWGVGEDASGWSVRYDSDTAGTSRAFLNLRSPLVVDNEGAGSSSVRLGGYPIRITARIANNGIAFETEENSGKKSAATFGSQEEFYSWLARSYGDDVANRIMRGFESGGTDTTVYEHTSTVNGLKMYSMSPVVESGFAADFARLGGYDGVICHNVSDVGDMACAFDPANVVSAEPSSYTGDSAESTLSGKFRQRNSYVAQDGSMQATDVMYDLDDFDFDDIDDADLFAYDDGDYEEDEYDDLADGSYYGPSDEELELARKAFEINDKILKGNITPEELDKAYLEFEEGSAFRSSIIYCLAKKALANSAFVDDDGELMRMYHGTTDGGFTVFNNDFVDDYLSFFFSPDLTAATYLSAPDVLLPMLLNKIRSGEYDENSPIILDLMPHIDNYADVYDLADHLEESLEYYNDYKTKIVPYLEKMFDAGAEHDITTSWYAPSAKNTYTITDKKSLINAMLEEKGYAGVTADDLKYWKVDWFCNKIHNGNRQVHSFEFVTQSGQYESDFVMDRSCTFDASPIYGYSDFEGFIEKNKDLLSDDLLSEYDDIIELSEELLSEFDLSDLQEISDHVNWVVYPNDPDSLILDYTVEDLTNVIGSGLKKKNPSYAPSIFGDNSIYRVALAGKNVLKIDAQGSNWGRISADLIPGFTDELPFPTETVAIGVLGFEQERMPVQKMNFNKIKFVEYKYDKHMLPIKGGGKSYIFSMEDYLRDHGIDENTFVSNQDLYNILQEVGFDENTAGMFILSAVRGKTKTTRYRKAQDGRYYRMSYLKDANQRTMTTREVARYARDHGYDGYYIENLTDWGGNYDHTPGVMPNINTNQLGVGSIAVVFDTKNIKSLDAETYDDDGNLILPSRRFDFSDPDIRYSVDPTMEEFLGFDTSARVSEEEANDWISRSGTVDDYSGEYAALTDRRWANKGRAYGTIRKGMDPKVRDPQVPNNITDDVAVSKSVRTIMESAHITDPDQIRLLQEMVLNQDIGTYTPETTQEVFERAQKDLADTYGGDLNRAVDGLQKQVSRGTVSDDTMALAQAIIAEAGKVGDFDLLIRAFAEYEIAGRIGGRIVSQATWLKKTSGVGQAYYMQRFVDQLNNYDYKARIDSGRMDPIVVDPNLLKRLALASDATTRETVVDEICQNIAEQIPPTLPDALRAWRYLSMLGNPTTHIRNFVGNVMMRGLAIGKDAVASWIEQAFVDEGDRTHAILTADDRRRMGGLADRMFDQYYDDIVADGKYSIRQEIERNYRNYFAVKKNGKYQASFLDKLSKINSEGVKGSRVILGLEGSDRVFLRAGFRDAFMQYIKANNLDINNMTEQQMRDAVRNGIEQAKINTFRNANQLATYLQRISEMNKVSNLIIEGLVPFKKTPMNILARGIDYSPLGLIVGLYDVIDNTIGAKGGETELRHKASEVVDKFASGFTGSALFVIGAILSKLGVLRGSGEDDDDYDKLLRENGEQPYSLNIGDYSLSLANIAPATIPLFMGVALNEAAEKTSSDNALMDLVSTLASVANPMMEMSLLSSINEALQAYGTKGIAGNLGNVAWSAAKSYAGQYLPTAPSKVWDMLDPIQRTTKSNAAAQNADIDYFARSLAKKTPLESTLEPMIDLHGREVNHGVDKFDLWLADTLSGFVSPGTIKVKHYDAADREIARLVRSTGSTDFVPSSPQKYLKVNGERVNLTAKQYTQFSKEYGQAIYSAINNLIYTQKYINASDPVRADMLSDAVSNAKKTIRNMWKDRVQFNVEEPVVVPQHEQEYELADTYIGE